MKDLVKEMHTDIIQYHLEQINLFMHNPNFYKLGEDLANEVAYVYVTLSNEYISRTDSKEDIQIKIKGDKYV